MARCWSHQRWWWLLLVLFAGLSRLGCSQKPSATAAAAAGTTTTTGPTPQTAIANPRIVVFLREQCDGELNSTELLRELQRGYTSRIGMVPKTGELILEYLSSVSIVAQNFYFFYFDDVFYLKLYDIIKFVIFEKMTSYVICQNM